MPDETKAPEAPRADEPTAAEIAEVAALEKKASAYDSLAAEVASLKAQIASRPPAESDDRMTSINRQVADYAKASGLTETQRAALLMETYRKQGLLDEAQAPALAREAELKKELADARRTAEEVRQGLGAVQLRELRKDIREAVNEQASDLDIPRQSKENVAKVAEVLWSYASRTDPNADPQDFVKQAWETVNATADAKNVASAKKASAAKAAAEAPALLPPGAPAIVDMAADAELRGMRPTRQNIDRMTDLILKKHGIPADAIVKFEMPGA